MKFNMSAKPFQTDWREEEGGIAKRPMRLGIGERQALQAEGRSAGSSHRSEGRRILANVPQRKRPAPALPMTEALPPQAN
jgi:hypothetical protein